MKFNTLTKNTSKILNHEKATAWKMTPELELYTAVVTASLARKFYETAPQTLSRIRNLIKNCDPIYVAKLAIYTREKMYLRSIPIVLLVELAKKHNGDSLVKYTVTRVVQRTDEIVELLAYYQWTNKRKGTKKLNNLSKQIQKGLAIVFNKFDEYQFAKYNRKTEVSLKDALFLVHPKAKDEAQQNLFNKIVEDKLETPYTWEVELSELGKKSFEDKAEKELAIQQKWEELIDSKRLGYMALMRNLRNILKAKVSTKHIEKIAQTLADPYQIKRAKQLPFRYLSAYRELESIKIEHVSYLLSALEKAVKLTAENIKGFDLDTKVVLASDVSGSMYMPISKRSKIRCYDIGLMLSMLLRNRSENVFTGIFGDTWKLVNLPKENILNNTMALNSIEGSVGYSTNGYKVVDDLIQKELVVDKVLFFTDLQMWDSSKGDHSLSKSWTTYKKNIAPNAKLYLFDLAGYGNTPINTVQKDIHLIAGWSDKIFDILAAIENGNNAIDEIVKMKL